MSASWTSRVRFEVRITRGGVSALIVPISGTVTWKSDRISSRYASNSSSARSISSMSRTGAIAVGRLERLEQRPADQEVGPEDVVRGRVLGLAARLEQPDLEHLARVVPLVDGRVDVEALVALEPDQRRARATRPGPWRARSCRRRPRPRAAAAGPAPGRGRRPSRAIGRRCSPASGSRPGSPRWNACPRGGCHGRSSAESTRAASRPASGPPAAERLVRDRRNPCAERGSRAVGYGGHGWHLGEGDGLAKGRDQGTTLSVLRTEDVPLLEVSGVCLRREAGDDMALVAFGDRTSIAAWVELPDDDDGAYVWKTVDLADVKGSLIPREDPQVEAVCADGAGRILILQESPPRVELLDWEARGSSPGSPSRSRPTTRSTTRGSTPRARRARAPRSCRTATCSSPRRRTRPRSSSSGRRATTPSGSVPDSALEGGARWPVDEGDHVFVPLAVWMPSEELLEACADFSDLEVGPDRHLYLLSDKSQSIARVAELVVGRRTGACGRGLASSPRSTASRRAWPSPATAERSSPSTPRRRARTSCCSTRRSRRSTGRDAVAARPRTASPVHRPARRSASARRHAGCAMGRTSPSSRSMRRRSSCCSSSATTRPGRSRRSSSTRPINRTFYFWHVYVVGVTPGHGLRLSGRRPEGPPRQRAIASTRTRC